MATSKKKLTKRPTSLKITQKDTSFTFQWKRGETYEKQTLQYQTRGSKRWSGWHTVKIEKGVSSKTEKLSEKDYYPYTYKVKKKNKEITKTHGKLTAVRFRVNAKAKDKKSSWSKVKMIKLSAPKVPGSLKASLGSVDNEGKFTWKVDSKSNDHRPYAYCEYQIKTFTDWNSIKAPEKFKAPLDKSGTIASGYTVSATSPYKDYVTDTSKDKAGRTFSQWIRVRALGAAGVSKKWATARYIFANPLTPVIREHDAKYDDATASWTITVKWDCMRPKTGAHPIDKFVVKYASGVPEAGGKPSSGMDFSNEGTTVNPYAATSKNGYNPMQPAQFRAAIEKKEDECIWVQVWAYHDNTYTASEAVRVWKNNLAAPEFTDSSLSGTTLTVTAKNNSTVPDSVILVYLIMDSDPSDLIPIGYIDHAKDTGVFATPKITGSHRVALQAVTGITEEDAEVVIDQDEDEEGNPVGDAVEYKKYSIPEDAMVSDIVYPGGGSSSTSGGTVDIPLPPENLTAKVIESDKVLLSWEWKWATASKAEITWSSDDDAWESTEEPSSYTIEQKTTSWKVGNLDPGVTYYFKVRLISSSGDTETKTAWSNTAIANLAAVPVSPSLAATEPQVKMDETISLACGYSGTGSFVIEIAEYTDTGIYTDANGDPVIILTADADSPLETTAEGVNTVYTAKGLTDMLWTAGSTHKLAARVSTASGDKTDWSSPCAVEIVPDLAITSITHDMVTMDVPDDEEAGTTRSVLALTDLPMIVTVEATGEVRTTSVIIQCADDFDVDLPNDKERNRYSGEYIYSESNNKDNTIEISDEDLTGRMSEGDPYKMICRITDAYGQKVEEEIDFEVHWDHNPVKPDASVIYNDLGAAEITIGAAPADVEEGDACDIYRLSIDYPQLIYRNAEYGATYYDPYPTLGGEGGYRVVAHTAVGDWTTADNENAEWETYSGDQLSYKHTVIIDWDNERIELPYTNSYSHSWDKDFERTEYLGGSVRGDWNPAVTRDLDIDSDYIILDVDADNMVETMRRLANWPGICHVRTPDGSNFTGNVTVSEKFDSGNTRKKSYSLKVQEVDPEGMDAMDADDWQDYKEDLEYL